MYYGPRLKGTRKQAAAFPTSLLGMVSVLRQRSYDRCYILRRSFSSAILPLLAGIPHRVGFSTEGRAWLLQRSTPYADKHEVECFLDVLRADDIPVLDTHNENWTDPQVDRRMDASLKQSGRTRIFICAKSVFDLKDWAPERFAETITWLICERNSEIHFCDSPGNAAYYASILAGVPAEQRSHCHDWSNQLSIAESGSLLKRMDLCFGIDTGFIHIAASYHVPVVGLYGPLEPWRWHPWDTKHTVLRPADVSGPRPLLRLSVSEVQTALEAYLPKP